MIADFKLSAILAVFLVVCVLGIYLWPNNNQDDVQNWVLPKALREASGLAMFSATTVLLHNDEKGVIYSFDIKSGSVSKQWTLGKEPVKDDFEGIEVVGDDIYMVTSGGLLYKAAGALQPAQPSLDFEIMDTQLGKQCEIEGLVMDQGMLLMPCKTSYVEEYERNLTVFAWSPGTRETAVRFSIPLQSPADRDPIRASAIETDRT
ncbi:MAG: hypothetical protein HUJ31_09580, partial [Pseudomonadales bacterium]|nr:hypothetical protein [Pseudomonadales bacterium]